MTTRTHTPEARSNSGFIQWKDAHRAHQVELGDMLNIGREPSNHIVLEDTFISARHARIERRECGFVLRDMRSRNGTFVNGTKVLEAELRDGDKIRVGSVDLTFTVERVTMDRPHLTSQNPRWNAQLTRLAAVAESPFPVMIMGPSGSGKDVLAQQIHRLSSRRAGPFVGVNCSALTESLVESELFGHVRGSFTGATHDRKGAFEAARGGTLFLDEVGDLPLALQPKLLRALENNQVRPVGSDRSVQTDVRIVAATHRNLKVLVMDGRFRADLFFRLQVLTMHAPALRDRMEDFDGLLYTFARQLRVRFSFGAIQRLKAHGWPGNIRELRNVVSRAKALHGLEEVSENDIPNLLDVLPESPSSDISEQDKSRSLIKEYEFKMIRDRLVANRGNQRKTALELGMAKSTLNDRIRHYGIDIAKLVEA